jgi:hypothetical protein
LCSFFCCAVIANMADAYDHINSELLNVTAFMDSLNIEEGDEYNNVRRDISAQLVALIDRAPRPIPMHVGATLVDLVKQSPFDTAQQEALQRSLLCAVKPVSASEVNTTATATDTAVKHSFLSTLGCIAYMNGELWDELTQTPPLSFNAKLQSLVDFFSRGGMMRVTPKTAADFVAVAAAIHYSTCTVPDSQLLYDCVHTVTAMFIKARAKAAPRGPVVWPHDPGSLDGAVWDALYSTSLPREPMIDITHANRIRGMTSCRVTARAVRDTASGKRAKTTQLVAVKRESSPSQPPLKHEASPSPSPQRESAASADLPNVTPAQLVFMCGRFGWSRTNAIALGNVLGISDAAVSAAYTPRDIRAIAAPPIADSSRAELGALVPACVIQKPPRVTSIETMAAARATVDAMESAAAVCKRPSGAAPLVCKRPSGAAPLVCKRPSAASVRWEVPITPVWSACDSGVNRNTFACRWYDRTVRGFAHVAYTASQQTAELQRIHKAAGALWDRHN